MAKRDAPITQEWIDKVSAQLVELGRNPPPRPRTFTRQNAIAEIAPLIRDLQRKAFTFDDIIPVLNAEGQNFTPASIKTYLTRVPTPPSEAPTRTVKKVARRASSSTSAGTEHDHNSNEAPSDGSRLRAPLAEGSETL